MIVAVFIALPALAGYASRDGWLPIAGRTAGGYGRQFATTIWITNAADEEADVSLAFCPLMQPNPAPATIAQFRLAPGQTRVLDDLGVPGVGSVHIRSTREVVGHGRVYSMAAGQTLADSIATSFNAIPAQFAIGNGETTTLQGPSFASGVGYRMYVAETVGQPIYFAIALLDPVGKIVGEKRLYLGPFEPRLFDLRQEFPSIQDGYALIRLTGVNGNGRLIATGSLIAAGSSDGTAYEMTFATRPRTRVGAGELTMYLGVALAIIAAAAVRLRRSRSIDGAPEG